MFRPGWEVRMVDAVRKEFPTQTIQIDCEAALNLSFFDMLCRLDDFGLEMIEQPLAEDDLVGHAMLQEAVRTPVCLDEGVTTVAQADVALELKSCRYMNIIPGRVGGLTAALAIHDKCLDAHVECWVRACRRPPSAPGPASPWRPSPTSRTPAISSPSDQLLAEDLAPPLLPAREPDGVQRVPLWTEPGIGIEPSREVLEKYCIAKAKVLGIRIGDWRSVLIRLIATYRVPSPAPFP